MNAAKSLLENLRTQRYTFICPSPETHARVVQHGGYAETLEEFFGWNYVADRHVVNTSLWHQRRGVANLDLRTVLSTLLSATTLQELQRASLITTAAGQDTFRSTVCVSNLYLPEITPAASETESVLYYIHSSFPVDPGSVFFGPDTYLFLSFLRAANHHLSKDPKSVVDVCCGSGAGAIHMARTYPEARCLGLDLNSRALELAKVNAEVAGTNLDVRHSNLYAAIPNHLKTDGIDVIVANPPYIASTSNNDSKDHLPLYADGGSRHGLELSVRIVEEGVKLLAADGVLMIYTAVAILKAEPGLDSWLEQLKRLPQTELVEYRIIHPDMWSEEIGKGPYTDVGRIQAVGAVLKKVKR